MTGKPGCCASAVEIQTAAWMDSGLGVEEEFQSGLEDTKVKPTRARIAMRPWEGKGIPGKPRMPSSQVSAERSAPAAKHFLHLKADPARPRVTFGKAAHCHVLGA